MAESKAAIINKLQKDILLWQGFAPHAAGKAKGMGLGPLETAFPNGVFPVGSIHEIICPQPEHAAAASGLVAGLLSQLMQKNGVCLWISVARKLFPPFLMAFDVEPDRVIFIDVQREKEALWAMEEALKCEGLAAVVAEIGGINLAQSRRLQLAVESSKVTGFLLRNDSHKPGATACAARWQVTSLPSQLEDELPGVGYPRWQVDLLRVRNGNAGSWKFEWANGGFLPVEEKIIITELHERKAG